MQSRAVPLIAVAWLLSGYPAAACETLDGKTEPFLLKTIKPVLGDEVRLLIMRGFSPQVCVVVPLTTSKKRDHFYISAGLVEGKSAAAIISQMRLIDTRRLINKVGTLDRELFGQIRKAVRKLL